MSSNVEEPLRSRDCRESRRIYCIPNPDAGTWPESQRYSVSPRAIATVLTRTITDLNLYVGQLTHQQKSNPAVKHALSVQRAISMGNYHALFDLYLNAPNMGAYIMDHFIDRERVKALMVMTKACAVLLLFYAKSQPNLRTLFAD